MRLVPNQKPEKVAKALAAYVKKIAQKSVKVEVRHLHSGTGWLAETDAPVLQAASRAVKRAFGKAPVFTREGGSIPVVASFARILKVPCVLMGFGLHDDNLHAPNEKMDLDNFFGGIQASAAFFEEYGGMPRHPKG